MRVANVEQYRQVLATIRHLREEQKEAETSKQLQELEAAAAHFAERLKGADLEKGHPKQQQAPRARLRREAMAEDPDFEEALADVAKAYASPRAILTDKALDRERKVALLKQWETDLRLLLVATEENMPGNDKGNAAEQLREVHQALQTLGEGDDGEHAGPNKSGG